MEASLAGAIDNVMMTDSLQRKAEEYMDRYPEVYRLFSHYAWELIMAGHNRIGSKAIAERIRWQSLLRKSDEEPYLVNNSYVTYMARKFMKDNPQCEGIFETRERKA